MKHEPKAGVAEATSALVNLLTVLCQFGGLAAVSEYTTHTNHGKRKLKFVIAANCASITTLTLESSDTAAIKAIEALIAQQSADTLGKLIRKELRQAHLDRHPCSLDPGYNPMKTKE